MGHSPKREPFDERVARHIRQDRNLGSDAGSLGAAITLGSVFEAPGNPAATDATMVSGWELVASEQIAAEMFDATEYGTGLIAPADGLYFASASLDVSSVINGGDGFTMTIQALDPDSHATKGFFGWDRVARLFYRSNGFEFSGSTLWAEEPSGVGGVSRFTASGLYPMAAGDLLAVTAQSYSTAALASVDVLAGSIASLALL